MAVAQESDPLERNTSANSYYTKTVRQDTTRLFYIDAQIRMMGYAGGGSDVLYFTSYDVINRETNKLKRRIDIRAELKKLGYGFKVGYANTKYFGFVSAIDRELVFGGGVGGGLGEDRGAFVAINLIDGSVIYHHPVKGEKLQPVEVTEDYCFAAGYYDRNLEDMKHQLLYILFDRNFKELLRINYNGDLGKGVEKKGEDLYRIPMKNGYLDLNVRAFLNAKVPDIITDTLNTKENIFIGENIITLVNDGLVKATFRNEETRTNQDVVFSKWDGTINSGEIENGKYFVKWSDYLPVGKYASIVDQKVQTKFPYLKLKESQSAYIFDYECCNNSHSGGMDNLALQIILNKK